MCSLDQPSLCYLNLIYSSCLLRWLSTAVRPPLLGHSSTTLFLFHLSSSLKCSILTFALFEYCPRSSSRRANSKNFGNGNRTPLPTLLLLNQGTAKNSNWKHTVNQIVEIYLEKFVQMVLETHSNLGAGMHCC